MGIGLVWTLVATLGSHTAVASTCDRYAAAVDRERGEALVTAFDKLAECDRALASERFVSFVKAAGDVETVVPLALVAIDHDGFQAVWDMMGKIPYENRSDIARGVGDACEEHKAVGTFLKGAYVGLKGMDFIGWQPALESCRSPDLAGWLEQTVAAPPTSSYNEKYEAVLNAFAKTRKGEALPALETAAIAAGKDGGPFTNILDTVQRAIQPEDFSDRASAEDVAAMEELFVRVASIVPSDSARLVSDRLYNTGNEALAASLLPALYPERVQTGGKLLWAGAAAEACDGQAVIHWVTFTEVPRRLDMVAAVTEPLRGSKPKLKCSSDEPWPVIAATEPLQSGAGAEAWVEQQIEVWTAKGFKVKAQQEKKLAVP